MNVFFFSIQTWKMDVFVQNLYFSYLKGWQRYALASSEKGPFLLVFCSSIGTDFGSKCPPWDQIALVSPAAGLSREAIGWERGPGWGQGCSVETNIIVSLWHKWKYTRRGSSIGSEFAWHASGTELDPHVRHILSWRLGSWKHFYGHSLFSTDSRRAVVSYWRKNVH